MNGSSLNRTKEQAASGISRGALAIVQGRGRPGAVPRGRGAQPTASPQGAPHCALGRASTSSFPVTFLGDTSTLPVSASGKGPWRPPGPAEQSGFSSCHGPADISLATSTARREVERRPRIAGPGRACHWARSTGKGANPAISFRPHRGRA